MINNKFILKKTLLPYPTPPILVSATHSHTPTSLSLYKQTAAELTPSTLHVLSFIKHTKAVFAVLKHTWTFVLVKLQVNWGSLFFHHAHSVHWEQESPALWRERADQSSRELLPPIPHTLIAKFCCFCKRRWCVQVLHPRLLCESCRSVWMLSVWKWRSFTLWRKWEFASSYFCLFLCASRKLWLNNLTVIY